MPIRRVSESVFGIIDFEYHDITDRLEAVHIIQLTRPVTITFIKEGVEVFSQTFDTPTDFGTTGLQLQGNLPTRIPGSKRNARGEIVPKEFSWRIKY